MSEETLSSAERMAILGKVAAIQKPANESKETVTENVKADSSTPFPVLLEMALKKQAKNHDEDVQMSDETRKQVVENIKPRFDIMKNWRF